MQENVALGSICAALLVASVWGGLVDIRLAGKVERETKLVNILTAGLGECVPSPAMVQNYAGCASKTYRTKAYLAARAQTLAAAY